MTIETILVALAFEDTGERVAERAVQLANQHQARLLGVHVVENLPPQHADLPGSLDPIMLVDRIKHQNADRLRVLLQANHRPAIVQVETGKPHAVIADLAATHHADLIVIGPGVARSVRERAFGSTADRVIRSAPCPVLVVRGEATEPYRRIVVGVDFSGHAKAAAQWAFHVAPTAPRELVHAVEIPYTFELAMVEAGLSQNEIEQYRQARLDSSRQQLVELFGAAGRLPKGVRLTVVQGEPATTLINASRRRRTDLLALGTLGGGAVTQHLLGSVARKVLAGTRCDALVVPASAT